MHATPVAATEFPASSEHGAALVRAPLHATAPVDLSAEAAAEVRRWFLLLGFPFVLAAIFFMAVIATGSLWLIGGAIVTGPGLLIMAFVYLGLSSDTNGAE